MADITRKLAEAQELAAANRQALFTLYTEDKLTLPAIVGRYFDGFTLINSTGFWQGAAEMGKVIEIVAPLADLPKVQALCRDINLTNNQSAVLLTVQELTSAELVTGRPSKTSDFFKVAE